MFGTILLVAAFVLFLIDMLGVPNPPRFKLQSAGFVCWVGALLFGPLLR